MIKQVKVTLNEKERVLEFGTMAFLEYYAEVTEKDPLLTKSIIETSGSLKETNNFYCALFFAGLKAYARKAKQEFTDTIEDVREWVLDMDQDEAAAVVRKYGEFNKPSEGEVAAQLNGQQPVGQN